MREWTDRQIAEFEAGGYWDSKTLAEYVADSVREQPDRPAFLLSSREPVSWREYDERASALASTLLAGGLRSRDRVAVILPDGPNVHIAYLAAEKAGLVVVAVSARSGMAEVRHVVETAQAVGLVTADVVRGRSAAAYRTYLVDAGVVMRAHVVVPPLESGESVELIQLGDATEIEEAPEPINANELFFINSTSGSTGLPKNVCHNQNRWKYFDSRSVDFSPDDVYLVAVPSPYGFGLWASHFSPIIRRIPLVQLPEFSPAETLQAIQDHRVTVLYAVPTQLAKMLADPHFGDYDLSSLRIVQSGGERVDRSASHEFENVTGAKVLQFYGSNEGGNVSGTHLSDPATLRLTTAGRILPAADVRLIDEDSGALFVPPGRGICAVRGPGICMGYLDGGEADEKLFTEDGWLRLGDVVEIDDDGYLTVVGRSSDFIIRGGSNISTQTVESFVIEHPDVNLVAVVGVTDDVMGERVVAFVTPVDGRTISLDSLSAHLADLDVSKNMWPEQLVVVEGEFPTLPGGKVDKARLREIAVDPALTSQYAARMS